MNVRELISQWRTVVISIAGILGIIISLLTIGLIFLDKQTAIAGGPPLSGGIVAAIIIKEAATALGNDKLAILAILIYVVQGFVGYPLTSVLLKKEGNRLLKDFKINSENKSEKIINNKAERKTLVPKLPEKYNTTYVILLKLAFVAYLADCFTKFINKVFRPVIFGYNVKEEILKQSGKMILLTIGIFTFAVIFVKFHKFGIIPYLVYLYTLILTIKLITTKKRINY